MAFGACIVPLQAAAVEVAAGQHEWSDATSMLGLYYASVTLECIVGVVMIGLGSWAHFSKRLLHPRLSLTLYGCGIVSSIVFRLLFHLEVLSGSCHSRLLDLQRTGPVVCAVLFAIGMIRSFG